VMNVLAHWFLDSIAGGIPTEIKSAQLAVFHAFIPFSVEFSAKPDYSLSEAPKMRCRCRPSAERNLRSDRSYYCRGAVTRQ